MSTPINNQNIAKQKQDVLEKFIEQHPFLFLLSLILFLWLFITYSSAGQKIYKTIQGFIVSPLNLECDSYDGQLRVAINISKPIPNNDYISGLMLIDDNAHNFLITPADYNFKLKYQKDDYYEGAVIIQEGGYRISIMQNKKDAIFIPNGGPSVPLLCYKIINE